MDVIAWRADQWLLNAYLPELISRTLGVCLGQTRTRWKDISMKNMTRHVSMEKFGHVFF